VLERREEKRETVVIQFSRGRLSQEEFDSWSTLLFNMNSGGGAAQGGEQIELAPELWGRGGVRTEGVEKRAAGSYRAESKGGGK